MKNEVTCAQIDIEAQKLFEEIIDQIQKDIAHTESGGSNSTIDDFAIF